MTAEPVGVRHVASRCATAIAFVLACALAGTAAGLLNPVTVGVGAFLVFAVVGLQSVGFALRRRREALSRLGSTTIPVASAQETVRDAAELSQFRHARMLYYAGLGTAGILVFRPAVGFTLSDWLFLAALLTALAERIASSRGGGARLPRGVLIGACLFALGGIASSVPLAHPGGSLAVVVKFLYLTIPWFWLGATVLVSPEHVRRAAIAWVAGGAVTASGAIVQFAAGVSIAGAGVRVGRGAGLTDQFNELGGICAAALLVGLVVALHTPSAQTRWVMWGLVALNSAGLAVSGSIGSTLGLVAGLAYLAVALPDVRKVVKMLALVAGCVATGLLATLYLGAASPAQRLSAALVGRPGHSGGSLGSRLSTYQVAWDSIRTRPFLGVGLNQDSMITSTGHKVHNLFLLPWYTGGLLALLGIVAIVWSVTAVAWRLTIDLSSEQHILNTALSSALIVGLVYAMSEPVLYQRFYWIPTALLIAAWNNARCRQLSGVRVTPKPTIADPSLKPIPAGLLDAGP